MQQSPAKTHHTRKDDGPLPSSFRDPDGFLFVKAGVLYRQIQRSYQDSYEQLTASGLLAELHDARLLIPHTDLEHPEEVWPQADPDCFKIIQPTVVPQISYPYEWAFSQLKDAARVTLEIQKQALNKGMTLKDASAYNVQFLDHRPVFIDTLSFEPYIDGQPWVAYRQFCQHFLAPLALMAHTDVRLSQLLRCHIDGIPLDLASRLLPVKTRLSFSLLTHIHIHANTQKRYESKTERTSEARVSKAGLLGLIDNLESAINKLTWKPHGTEWGDYYDATNYSDDAFINKRQIVETYLKQLQPETVWDLGANTGEFSRVASQLGINTVAFDIDPAAVEKNYRQIRAQKETHLLPLVMDLTNPSPGLGWSHRERDSMIERGPVDTAMALALIHHLAISNNLPLDRIARFFSQIADALIIEFVPKSDSQVQRLLSTREDIFPNYVQPAFEQAFGQFFDIIASNPVVGSERVLYAMRKKTL